MYKLVGKYAYFCPQKCIHFLVYKLLKDGTSELSDIVWMLTADTDKPLPSSAELAIDLSQIKFSLM